MTTSNNPAGYALAPDAGTDRYGTPEYVLDNEVGNAEIKYPNGVTKTQGGNYLGETVEQENPSLFYVEKLPHEATVSPNWVSNTFALGIAAPSQILIAANDNRKRLLVWATGGSPWLTPNPSGATGQASGSVIIPSVPIEFTHTGPVYVTGDGAAATVVYFFEESYA